MDTTKETKLALYYSKYCFFCQKVLTFMRGGDFDVELRNTSDREHAQALMAGGGKTQVPCLRIEQANGDVQWMYESDDIIRYLG
ncbi:glutaredoxin family protein [Arenicella xantha]|uniref:Glutathione S-transferase-like protein n=1 Tax=Arenicella xantha TaxID=644221 RepID=A0A395JN99_9GAMM|nr:glutathione S-transferase N-terminal domain-containing protein [Arenicella xantha]RBP53144.1 glutathione S-transferase-like protein [Arenicella xantha]